MNSRKKTFFALVVISLFSFLTFAQVYFGDSDSVNYRGKREPRESGDFSVLNISTSRTSSSTVRFDILFNQTIDPNSVGGASFYINGNKAGTKGKTEFSKDGKKIRIELDVKDSSFNFELKGVASYNGKLVNKISVKLKDNGEVRVSSD